jgi:hypothetical protein
MNKRTTLLLAVAAALFSTAAHAADEDMRAMLKALGKQVEELKQHSHQSDAKIRELENNLEQEKDKNRQLAVAPVAAPKEAAPALATAEPKKDAKPPVTLGDVKGTFKVPGTDTSLGIGGYVKMDAAYNSVSAGSDKFGDQYLYVPQIPVTPTGHRGEDSQLNFTARETRFWLKSFTPSKYGDISTYMEMDFLGAANSYTPRLRHAYGSMGNFLAGLTWTTFLNDLALPDLLDAGGPVGSSKIRQPLVRWTQPFKLGGESMEFLAAVEAPTSSIYTSSWSSASPETLTTPNDDRYPDMVTKLNYKPSWGILSLAAMGRQIRNHDNTSGVAREQWGGAISLAGKINMFELDNLRFSAGYGNAYGRYMGADKLEDAALDSAGNLHLVNVYNGVIAYQHWWDKAWRSTLAYGFEQADQPTFVNQAMTRQAQSVHANLLWSPLPQATLGFEYIYGTRELIDGTNGNISRAQLSAKYNF